MPIAAESPGREPVALLPILMHVQSNLDGDLSLSRLAGLAGRSPAHFQRLFKRRVGETPRSYVERLRLEHAALRLWLLRTSVLDVALAVGYDSHETFTRAFRRRFGVLPKTIRKEGIGALGLAASGREDHAAAGEGAGYSLSATRIVELEPLHLASIRHVGPYEEVTGELFAELQEWAARRLAARGPLLGIGHDAPGVTPADKLRFDAAVRIDGPFPSEDRVAYQELRLGRCAMTTHVGSFATLPHAYGILFQRILAMPRLRPLGAPAVEVYHERRIDVTLRFNHTDIYLPVAAKPRNPGLHRGPSQRQRAPRVSGPGAGAGLDSLLERSPQLQRRAVAFHRQHQIRAGQLGTHVGDLEPAGRLAVDGDDAIAG